MPTALNAQIAKSQGFLSQRAWSSFNLPLLGGRTDARRCNISEKLKPATLLFRGGKDRRVQFRAFIAMFDPIALGFAYHWDAIFFAVREDLRVFLIQ